MTTEVKSKPSTIFDPTDCENFSNCGKITAYYSGDVISIDCGPGECDDYKEAEEE